MDPSASPPVSTSPLLPVSTDLISSTLPPVDSIPSISTSSLLPTVKSSNCHKFNDNIINKPYSQKHCVASTNTDGSVNRKCHINLNHTEKFFTKNNILFK